MTYARDEYQLIPIEASLEELRIAAGELVQTFPNHPLARISFTSHAPGSRKATVTLSDEHSALAGWHNGQSISYTLSGELDTIIHYANLTSDEHENVLLTARHFHHKRLLAIATATSDKKIESLESLSKLKPLHVLGLIAW